MKRTTSSEKSTVSATLIDLSNKDLRDKFLQARKAIEEYPLKLDLEKADETLEELEELLHMEEVYSNELKKRELLEWALKTGR